ncbi:MAG: GNAT family N-acetyltransferase [Burkholderiales bacterium]|nr:GNAT family N-acetyltransferase [Burkholderiales bacterium]
MRATWSGLERDAWMRLHRTAAAALQQDWAYGDAMGALGTECLRAWVDEGGEPVAAAQFLVRRIGGLLPVALCSHGPVWAPGTIPERQAAALQALRASAPLRWPRALLYTPDAPLADCTGFARLRRVMTGHSTVRIDLALEPDALRAAMHGKWRNRLAAAERSALKVERVGAKPAQYRWLLDHELAQRRRRGYIALPDGFVEAWQAAAGGGAGGRAGGGARSAKGAADLGEPVLTLRADLGRDVAAGMMFLVHGEAATYQIGWVGEAGRELGAHNLLLWHAMLELRGRGVRTLDLGGVDTARGAGLARFKLGTDGEVVTLAGSYLAR